MKNKVQLDLEKVQKAHSVFRDSIVRLPSFKIEYVEDPLAMEPFDALASRFERCLEVLVGKFLRTLEIHETGLSSPTLRDRLNFAHKIGIVSDVEVWLEMRDFRNRIAHDYLPEQLAQIFAAIQGRFAHEIERTTEAIRIYVSNL